MQYLKSHTCCFFGHRKIDETEDLKKRLYDEVEKLIVNENVHTFLFGSRSEFDDLCLKVVTKLKEKYPHINRIYVRAEFPYVNENFTDYLLENYDGTYYPEKLLNAGKAAYVERNYKMIDSSSYCICYYDKNYTLANKKSGTKLAYSYANKKKICIINMFANKKRL